MVKEIYLTDPEKIMMKFKDDLVKIALTHVHPDGLVEASLPGLDSFLVVPYRKNSTEYISVSPRNCTLYIRLPELRSHAMALAALYENTPLVKRFMKESNISEFTVKREYTG